MDSSIYEAEDKSQRRRVIIITTAIALIVLGIAAWAIIAIVSGGKTQTASNTDQVAVDDSSASQSAIVESSKNSTESTSATSNVAGTSNTASSTSASTAARVASQSSAPAAQNSVPDTGPEELLPVALVAGTGVAYLGSRKLVKRELVA